VRTPLNAIINYLEIALEGTLDQETRDNLAKSHSASKSLIYVINDLLDLTKTEEGQELIKDEIIDLQACLREATEPFKVDAKRKGIDYRVIEHPGLPRWVHGDQRRVRQAIANMTANAVAHTTKGFVQIECFVTEVVDKRVNIEVVVQDTGCGMSDVKLDALFRELEQVSTDNDESITAQDETSKSQGGRALGLGLAVVARIVRNMDGQLRLKSEKGVGSRFVVQLPFEIPSGESLEQAQTRDRNKPQSSAHSSIPSVTTTLPPIEAGEVTLVATNPHTPNHPLKERRSYDSVRSAQSLKSASSMKSMTSKESGGSTKSDADRLIDAIQTPLSYGDGDSEELGLRPRSAKDSSQSHAAFGTVRSLPGAPASSEVGRDGRPSHPTRSSSTPLGHFQTLTTNRDGEGMSFVTDSKTPIRPIKVPDEFEDQPTTIPQTGQSSRVLFELSDKKEIQGTQAKPKPPDPDPSGKLQVLIAEDDPVNMKILRKRLEKTGHGVSHTVNGEDCAAVYSENPRDFDVILMDMQVCCEHYPDRRVVLRIRDSS
jgi:anti-sigma regulatory factor (Ser/Thr protein kinase)